MVYQYIKVSGRKGAKQGRTRRYAHAGPVFSILEVILHQAHRKSRSVRELVKVDLLLPRVAAAAHGRADADGGNARRERNVGIGRARAVDRLHAEQLRNGAVRV